MNLAELVELQAGFDTSRPQLERWAAAIDEDRIDVLEFLITALAGEVGELANITKKIVRGDTTLPEQRGALGEEMADVFIYLMKLSRQLDVDLERAYLSKMAINAKRFPASNEPTNIRPELASLETAKGQSPEWIRDLIRALAQNLDEQSVQRLSGLVQGQHSDRIPRTTDSRQLAEIVLLGIVAADVAREFSPVARQLNIEKLQLAATELGIAYESAVEASILSEKALQLLSKRAPEGC